MRKKGKDIIAFAMFSSRPCNNIWDFIFYSIMLGSVFSIIKPTELELLFQIDPRRTSFHQRGSRWQSYWLQNQVKSGFMPEIIGSLIKSVFVITDRSWPVLRKEWKSTSYQVQKQQVWMAYWYVAYFWWRDILRVTLVSQWDSERKGHL